MRRPRVAYFSPLSPNPSGISDYSQELLPHLAQRWEIDLFVDGYEPTAPVALQHTVIDAAETDPIPLLPDYDLVLYHLGNSPAHSYAYRALLAHRGAVVLHDVALTHLVASLAIDAGRRDLLFREMREQHGDDAAETLRRHYFNGELAPWQVDPMRYPLNRRVLERATAILVHSRFAADALRAAGTEAPVHVLDMHAVVPQGVPAPAPPPAREPGELVVCTPGYLTPNKRIASVLEALARLRRRGLRFHYHLVGALAPAFPIEGVIRDLGLHERVTLHGRVDQLTLYRLVCDADVCVNLRHPTCGETSAMVLRILACGRPVVVSDVGWFRELPDAAVRKVPDGEREVDALAETLEHLAAEPAHRAALAEAAARYAARLTPARLAEQYRHRLDESTSQGGSGIARPAAVLREACRDLGLEADPALASLADDLCGEGRSDA
jgi:glycosyltransferase involved in cell wall biosynthesis